MNYRHAYHAGNTCDVVKHAILCLLLDYLKQKDKGFAVLDTHAGTGRYDLSGEQAQKTREANEGIQGLWKNLKEKPPLLRDYLTIVEKFNPTQELTTYPGSPLLTLELERPQDRLIACELHPEDNHTLYQTLHTYPNVQIHRRDGYEAIKAFLPFPEKRGLIFIDPPYEKPDEYQQLVKAIQTVATKAPGHMLAIWYPIKERPSIWRFHEDVAKLGLLKTLIAEFIFCPEQRSDRLNGSGFLFLNPPWVLEEQLRDLFPLLHEILQTTHQETIIKSL
ncbi:MAG: 23S rRNA (adenine(2030)-N(6))-methyltransferase RlmJ [Bdellovibrionales bacterium]